MTTYRCLVILLSLIPLAMPLDREHFGSLARAAEESPKNMLAAQIRSQGVACNNPQRAVRDAKRSKPDHDVWVLTCDNAVYRVSRYPDLAAKIERLR